MNKKLYLIIPALLALAGCKNEEIYTVSSTKEAQNFLSSYFKSQGIYVGDNSTDNSCGSNIFFINSKLLKSETDFSVYPVYFDPEYNIGKNYPSQGHTSIEKHQNADIYSLGEQGQTLVTYEYLTINDDKYYNCDEYDAFDSEYKEDEIYDDEETNTSESLGQTWVFDNEEDDYYIFNKSTTNKHPGMIYGTSQEADLSASFKEHPGYLKTVSSLENVITCASFALAPTYLTSTIQHYDNSSSRERTILSNLYDVTSDVRYKDLGNFDCTFDIETNDVRIEYAKTEYSPKCVGTTSGQYQISMTVKDYVCTHVSYICTFQTTYHEYYDDETSSDMFFESYYASEEAYFDTDMSGCLDLPGEWEEFYRD